MTGDQLSQRSYNSTQRNNGLHTFLVIRSTFIGSIADIHMVVFRNFPGGDQRDASTVMSNRKIGRLIGSNHVIECSRRFSPIVVGLYLPCLFVTSVHSRGGQEVVFQVPSCPSLIPR